MQFSLSFSVPKIPVQISHGKPVVLFGSCFSDELEVYFRKAGFEILSNPFGTVFHPTALSSVIQSSLTNAKEVDVYQRSDVFFSWDASSKVFGMDDVTLRTRIADERELTREKIRTAQTIIITFGSAFGYRHKELNKIVANCHKAPPNFFEKELSSVEEMYVNWLETIEKIKEVNPDVQLLFTVSPVRHSKDGLVENTRSKARLIELVHGLCEVTNAHYFPSYELVLDDLRDYRFFKKDMVHPNTPAIEYVWEQFSEAAFSEETREIIKKVNAYYQSAEHVSIHPDSSEAKKHADFVERMHEEILTSYGGIVRL